jgi:hypothetical protein
VGLFLVIAIGNESTFEVLTNLARMKASLDLGTGNIQLRSITVDSTINRPGTEGSQLELARDRDPTHRVGVTDKDFVFIELKRDMSCELAPHIKHSYIDLVVRKANGGAGLQAR